MQEKMTFPLQKRYLINNFINGKVKLLFSIKGQFSAGTILFDKDNVYAQTKGMVDEWKHNLFEDTTDKEDQLIFEFIPMINNELIIKMTNLNKEYSIEVQMNPKEDMNKWILESHFVVG